MRYILTLLFLVLFIFNCHPCQADSYEKIPIYKQINTHKLIVIGQLSGLSNNVNEFKIVKIIKGAEKKKILFVASPRMGFFERPITNVNNIGELYLLFLNRESNGTEFVLDSFQAIVRISAEDDPQLRAVEIMYKLLQVEEEQRVTLLDEVWVNESNKTKYELLQEFYYWKSDSVVKFLSNALRSDDFSLMEHANIVIKVHGYRETIPILIESVLQRDSIHAARTLGELKAQEGYEAIIEAINNPEFGSKTYLPIALGDLGDPRAIPVLIRLLNVKVGENNEDWQLDGNGYAALALAKLKAVEAIKPIIDRLEKGGYADTKIIDALGEFGTDAKEALPLLLKILVADEDNQTRNCVQRAIDKIEGRNK
ncbi:MAG: hypothetical protein WAQ98_08300 [Blastocatellia bacterium]